MASLVRSLDSDEHVLGGTIYQIRTAVASSDAYRQVMGLEMAASRRSIAAEFLVWSVVMAAAAALGVVLSLFLSAPIAEGIRDA